MKAVDMVEDGEHSNLPAQIGDAIAGIPKALVPAALKAADRLIGAAVDIPAAWLAQQKAKIDAQTEAYKLVEASIGRAAASTAGTDPAVIERAMGVLIRKSYRAHTNREAVVAAMLDDLSSRTEEHSGSDPEATLPPVDDDWLNVFERFAEDASSERMQGLWGRVLAGEVRTPGKFSLRTLRFLSEFSQIDALEFTTVVASSFCSIIPKSLVVPESGNISTLIYLESIGLIQGASGMLSTTVKINGDGFGFIIEDNVAIALKGTPNLRLQVMGMTLTPLGQELLSLIPGRDLKSAGRNVANTLRRDGIVSAQLMRADSSRALHPMEIIWDNEQGEIVEMPN